MKRTIGGVGAVLAAAALIAISTTSAAAATDVAPPSPSPAPEPTYVGLDYDSLPEVTQDFIDELRSEGRVFHSVTTTQFSSDPTGKPPGALGGSFASGQVSAAAMNYVTIPCYLTVVVSSFGNPGQTVDNDSLTGCTNGVANGTRHIMTVDKKDLFWGGVVTVASAQKSNAFGTFSSSISYVCPNGNQSDFMATTQGRVSYNGTYYYASGSDGWDRYYCG